MQKLFDIRNGHVVDLLCDLAILGIIFYGPLYRIFKVAFTHMPQLISQHDRGHQFAVNSIQFLFVGHIQRMDLTLIIINTLP